MKSTTLNQTRRTRHIPSHDVLKKVTVQGPAATAHPTRRQQTR